MTTRAQPAPPGTEASLDDFARLIALAVSNAEDRALLARQAATDPLTGLANHRTFQERLLAETRRCRRHGGELALILVDLDDFKQVNDTYGHQVGDRVLAHVAGRLGSVAREGEMLARIGGEEFAWLLPECDSHGGLAAAERLREAVRTSPPASVDRLTISAGICDLTQARGSSRELVRLADGALYWAKTHGRDLCVRYSPDVVAELSASESAAKAEKARRLGAIRALARAVDARDRSTRMHSERVAELATRLAGALGWTEERIGALFDAALVHDVGKIGIPDVVLLKAGPLTPAEYAQVKEHAVLGARIVPDVLTPEQTSWVRHHHERWDGCGYPDGLAGDAIPDGAAVIGVADAWDAITTERSYRAALSVPMALEECRRCAGTQFAPHVVAALEQVYGSETLRAGGGHAAT